MNKADKVAKLKAAGLDDEAIESILSGDDNASKIAALEAKIAEAEGKAGGILGDKKKAQQRADELQAKLDELEGKDLGESERLKLEVERMKSRMEATEAARAELETTYKTEKRTAELNKIAGKLKHLDTMPDDAWNMLVSNELKDLEDLGNTVLVEDRLKSVSQKYSGLLVADVPTGAGAKAGQTPPAGNRPNLETVKSKSLSEISADPQAYVADFMAAAEAQGE